MIETSLVTGEGLEQLEEAIMEKVFSGDLMDEEGGSIYGDQARRAPLQGQKEHAGRVRALEENYPLDIISIDLRQYSSAWDNCSVKTQPKMYWTTYFGDSVSGNKTAFKAG